jgi:flagella basal body P-ring formation protein FlgA
VPGPSSAAPYGLGLGLGLALGLVLGLAAPGSASAELGAASDLAAPVADGAAADLGASAPAPEMAASWPGLRSALAAVLSVPVPDARIDVLRVVAPPHDRCGSLARADRDATYEIPHPIEGSSRVAVKVTAPSGPGRRAECVVWLWADVRVMGTAPVTRYAIRAGERLSGAAVRLEIREIRLGHPPAALDETSVADRFLGAGQMVEPSAARAAGLRNGDAVKVVLVAGAMMVEQNGRALACGRAQCAVLPSGKHVEGILVDGRLMVNVQ